MRVRVIATVVLVACCVSGLRLPEAPGGGGRFDSFRGTHAKSLSEALRLASVVCPLFVGSYARAASEAGKQVVDLAQRIKETDSLSFEPGLEARDVYYPQWFTGTFQANSTGLGVWAPLGIEAFGGQNSYNAALKDVNTSLVYDCRFGPDSNLGGNIVADRLFNVESIARASMGPDCVIPNYKQPDGDLARRLHLVLSPKVGYDIYDIDLFPTDRLYSMDKRGGFQVMERTAQIISTRMEQLKASPAKPFRKDIETIALYSRQSDDVIECLQRTATFLTRVDSRFEQAVARTPSIADRAIDIRLYRIIYTKL